MEDDETGEEEPAPMDENAQFLSQIGFKCLCSNLEEYRALVSKFEKSKHPDEKELVKLIIEDILPNFEKEEQKRKKKLLEEEKERARLELLAGRKRSARVDERIARQREAEERELVRQREHEEHEREMKEVHLRQKEEEARLAKLEEREKRLQERELRAKQREAERVRLLDPDATESDDNIPSGSRKSSRQKEKRKAELETEDKDWVFDCICGIHGQNYDDGTFSIACDRCGVWQHTKCLGLPESAAEEDEFICDRCKDKELAAKSPPIKIKIRLNVPAPSEGEGNEEAIRPLFVTGLSNGLPATSTSSIPSTDPKTITLVSKFPKTHRVGSPSPETSMPLRNDAETSIENGGTNNSISEPISEQFSEDVTMTTAPPEDDLPPSPLRKS
ncbi:hypothetical protein ABW19_dt0206232 [Dactylella cylindrospora]|nr:hypothetical protein ABW19_dt0206232 [Dactylella cylindrospora]